MSTQPAGRAPVTAAAKSRTARAAGSAGRFAAELGGMSAVMCLGGAIVSFATFTAAGWLGFPGLARQAPGLSALIIAVCLAVPMAVYMAVQDHGRRHNAEMTGSTLGAGVLMAGLLWSGVIPATGVQNWHSLFMLVCGPACLLMVAEMLIGFGTYWRSAPDGLAAQRPQTATAIAPSSAQPPPAAHPPGERPAA